MKIIKITNTVVMDRMGKALVQRLSKKKIKLFSLTNIKSGKTINGIRTQKKTLVPLKKQMLLLILQDARLLFKF